MLNSLPQSKHVNWIPSLATIAMSTLGGGAIGGTLGAAAGLSSALVDELLIHHNIEKKHYLSTTLFWNAFTITPFTSYYFPSLSFPLNQAISCTSALALSYFTNDFLNLNEKLNPVVESLSLLNRFSGSRYDSQKDQAQISWKTFKERPIQKLAQLYKSTASACNSELFIEASKIVSLSLLGIAADFYLLKYLGSYGKSLLTSSLLEKYLPLKPSFLAINAASSSYLFEGAKFATLLVLKSLLSQGVDLAQCKMKVGLSEKILKQAAHKFFEEQNGRKINTHENGAEIGQNLTTDLYTLVNESLKIDLFAKQFFSACLSCGVLFNLAPSLTCPYLLSLVPVQMGYSYLADQVLKVKKDYVANKIKYYVFTWIATNQVEQVKLRDAELYMQNKLEKLGQRDQKLTAQEQIFFKLKNESSNTLCLFHNFLDLIFVAYPVFQAILSIENIPLIKESLSHIFTFFSSNLLAKIDQSSLTLSIERLKKLFEIIELPPKPSAKRFEHQDYSLKIKNYSLYLEDSLLLSIKDLDFKIGKTYALTGPSGCGKTSLLMDLKIGAMGALSSSGEFFFPLIKGKPAKTLFLNQDLFLLPETTLLENILFPKIYETLSDQEVKEYEERILALFDELQMDPTPKTNEEKEETKLSTRLHSKTYKLSGGQAKKIGLIQAILSKPDILFLDETFAGLDEYSRCKCQKALKKYLPHSLILVVDHHAEDNNKNHFYDAQVDFSNRSACKLKI